MGCTRQFVRRIFDGVKNGAFGFTGWLSIGDSDDENRLSKLVRSRFLDNQRFQNFSLELRAHWGQSFKLNSLQQGIDLLWRANVVPLDVAVHESDFNPIRIKERSCKGGLLKNKLQVIDPLAILLE